MMPLAKHGILIVCDSDVRISENCLGVWTMSTEGGLVAACFISYMEILIVHYRFSDEA